MVGTVYLQSGPGEPPFIKIGDRVNAGDVVIIIEAMKVMNQIPAPHGGIVRSIDVADAQAVEFGEVLMVIE
jgi:acetyl-CoA carboxylase biotin carboxyl carrier protein